MEKKSFQVALTLDMDSIANQIQELMDLFEAQSTESVLDRLFSNLGSLPFDVVFGDCCSTVRADGTIEIVQRLRLGSGFERLRATLLADKRNLAHR
jgi:hypothetical protein